MRRRNENTNLPRESVLKIDKDCHVNSQLENEYVQTIITILSMHNLKVELIKASRTRHGMHYYIKIDPSVDAHTANRLQYLLGDDSRRVAFDEARINSQLFGWNKLFELPETRLRTIYSRVQRHTCPMKFAKI